MIKKPFFILLVQLPFYLHSAEIPNYALPNSQFVTITNRGLQEDVIIFLESHRERITNFFELEEKNQVIEEHLRTREKNANRKFLTKQGRKEYSKQKRVRKKTKYQPKATLSKELLKKKLYEEKKATLAKVNQILDSHNDDKTNLIVPLEILSEAFEEEEETLKFILEEEQTSNNQSISLP